MTDASSAPRHGGLVHDELARLGLVPEAVLDVSVNVNPYGPCPSVVEAIRAAPLDRYPDPTAAPARGALAAWLGVPAERIVVGNGAVELLWALAARLAAPGEPVLIVEPAFSELRTAAERRGARIVEHRLRPEDDFALDGHALDALGALLRRERPRLAYLSTPGNPTGNTVPLGTLLRLADEHRDTRFVVDLSFSSLSEGHRDELVRASESIVWVRSLTKDLGLAGLRVGFAVMPPHLAAALEAYRPPWSVNGLAQAAAIAATGDAARAFVEQSRLRLLADRAQLDLGLGRLGLRVHPSETLYSLVDLGPARRATPLRGALLTRHAVLIRDGTSFGLPHHVRLCARPADQTDRVLAALERELSR